MTGIATRPVPVGIVQSCRRARRPSSKMAIAMVVLTLPGCVSTSLDHVNMKVVGAVTTEAAAAARCPQTKLERAALFAARAAFDQFTRGTLAAGHHLQVARARATTDEICGIEESPSTTGNGGLEGVVRN